MSSATSEEPRLGTPSPGPGRLARLRSHEGLADRRVSLLLLIVVTGIVMSQLSPFFLAGDNLLRMTQYGAVIGLLALGQSLVILGGGGGIDLSVGSTLSLCTVCFGWMTVNAGLNPWLAVTITLLAGVVLGAVNALLVTWLGIPPLIATLGTLYLYSSGALVLAGGVDISGFDRAGYRAIGQTAIAGIPTQVLLVLVPAFVVAAAVMARTRFGRQVYHVGSNAPAAELAGIDVRRVRAALYCTSGILAALGAVVTTSWLLTAQPTAGNGLELQAVTIAVLGGTAITGGVGLVGGTFLALALVVVLNSGLQLAGVSNTWQVGLLGVVLIGSVLFNQLVARGPRA